MYVASGSDDTVPDKYLQNLPIADSGVLTAFAECEGIHFTVVDLEAPLVIGIVGPFRAEGLRIFEPTEIVAQPEPLKNSVKAFMHRRGIPTAKYQTFSDAA